MTFSIKDLVTFTEEILIGKTSFLCSVQGNIFFFSIRVFFQGHWWFTGQQGKRRDQLYSILPLSPDHEYSDIYLQLCIWDDYHVFLIASHVVTRLLLDEIYHHWELTIDSLLIKYWLILMIFSARSCYSGQSGKPWIWIRINYHHSIKSDPTNTVR